MKIQFIATDNNLLKNNKAHTTSVSTSFNGVDKFLHSSGQLSVSRLGLYSNVNQEAFKNLATQADEIADKFGNFKPKLLVDTMALFIDAVESRIAVGRKFHGACVDAGQVVKSMFRESNIVLEKELGSRGISEGANSYRWRYLAAQGGKKELANSVKPESDIISVKGPIVFTYIDQRDMFEFMRRNWTRGNAAYRNVMMGKGTSGWLKYLREELFPNHYDEFSRKY